MRRISRAILGKIAKSQVSKKIILNEQSFERVTTEEVGSGFYDYEQEYKNFCTKDEYLEAISHLPKANLTEEMSKNKLYENGKVLDVEAWKLAEC